MSGTCLDAARVALDAATGRPCRLLWSPVSLAALYQGRVRTWHLGTPAPRGPRALPSWLWPPAVFTAVVSALAEAFIRDLTDTVDSAGMDEASA